MQVLQFFIGTFFFFLDVKMCLYKMPHYKMSLYKMSCIHCKPQAFQKAPITRLQLWNLLLALFLPFTTNPSQGLQIISRPVSPRYAAVGDKVTFHCLFTLAPEDLGRLDIEWSIMPADPSAEETVVIWNADRIYYYLQRCKGRVRLVSPDPASGNGSITISYLKLTDSDTYQRCPEQFPRITDVCCYSQVMINLLHLNKQM